MSWKFINKEHPAGAAEYERVNGQIKDWWQLFEMQSSNLERYLTDADFKWDIEEFIEKNLQNISPKLMWEVDGWGKGRYFFSITAEGERHLQPLVESIVSAAPKMENWTIFDQRLPSQFEELDGMLKESAGLRLNNVMYRLEPQEGNCFALVFAFVDCDQALGIAYESAFLTSEMLIGEKLFDCWIASVAVEETAGASRKDLESKGFHSISELPNEVLGSIDKINSQLHNTPLHRRKDELQRRDFSLDPEKSDDYGERLDMMAASSIIPEIWKAAHSEVTFDSIRFSKQGERFCYLKMDGTDSYANSAQSRDRLAKTLDERLLAADLGCTTGGASGLKYSYIDLVLTDVDKALPIIKEAVSYEHMPNRSWLLFFDVEWSREWVAMYSETPPPPLMPHPFAVDS